MDSIDVVDYKPIPSYWKRDSTYGPGDEVKVHTVGKSDISIYQCQAEPYSDFCGIINPETTIGKEFWQIKTADSYLKAKSSEKITCIPYETPAKQGLWIPGDKACEGENVWTCREVAGNEWCNTHTPGTDYGVLMWKLESGVAHPAELSQDGKETFADVDPNYVQPTTEEMMHIFDDVPIVEGWDNFRPAIVLDVSLEHFWDIFFADGAPYATDTFLEQKDVNNHIKSMNEWHVPEGKFVNFPWDGRDHKPIMQERDLKLTIRANFIYPHLPQDQTTLLADRTDTYLSVYVNCKNYDSICEDDYNINLHWEVMTPSPQANKVVVRYTSQVDWFERTFIASDILENNYESVVCDTLDFYRTWAKEKIEEDAGRLAPRTEPMNNVKDE
jgi:hypothetical protein